MKRISIRRRHARHPWIFSNEIKKPKEKINPGEIVEICKGKEFLGRGFYNPNSLIAIRQYSDRNEDFDETFIGTAFSRALAYRKDFVSDNSFRLIFSESDGLPGLIVDKYEDDFVIQVHAYGIEIKKEVVVNALLQSSPKFIYEKSDERLRQLEGLAVKNGLVYGQKPDLIEIKQDGIKFLVDIEKGQKTGFFFDLREIRQRLSEMVRDKTVLDLFCYTGGFSLYAAKGNAQEVTGIDSSMAAVELARQNAELNSMKQTHFECADAFDYLRNTQSSYDIIILDPPSFIKSKKELPNARRGYKEINLQAMKKLKQNGVLVTTCCSYHFSEDEFLRVLSRAAADSGKNFRIIKKMSQALDHPILLNMPETNYLKCFFLRGL